MADTRQAIVDAIKARFLTIQKSTYRTDIGKSGNVYICYPRVFEEAQLDALNVFDETDEKLQEGAGSPYNIDILFLHVRVDVVAKAGITTAETIRQYIEDVKQAIGTDETWGGLGFRTIWGGSKLQVVTLRSPQGTRNIIEGARIMFRIEYRTRKWQSSL